MHFEFLLPAQTVNKEYYLSLMRRLRETIRLKRSELGQDRSFSFTPPQCTVSHCIDYSWSFRQKLDPYRSTTFVLTWFDIVRLLAILQTQKADPMTLFSANRGESERDEDHPENRFYQLFWRLENALVGWFCKRPIVHMWGLGLWGKYSPWGVLLKENALA